MTNREVTFELSIGTKIGRAVLSTVAELLVKNVCHYMTLYMHFTIILRYFIRRRGYNSIQWSCKVYCVDATGPLLNKIKSSPDHQLYRDVQQHV